MGKTIRISDEVVAYLAKHGHYGESADDVLRRLLGIAKKEHKDAPTATKVEATDE